MTKRRIHQRAKADRGGGIQMAGGNQEDISLSTQGERAKRGGLVLITIAALLSAAALALLILGLLGKLDWKVVVVPLVVALLGAVAAALAAR